jgi:hypothetical protein
VQYQRSSLRDRSSDPAVTKRSPDKLGIGAIASVALGEFDTVDIAPLYVVDYEQHSRVISIKANWIPDFLRQIDGMGVLGSYPLVRGLLVFRLTPRVLFQGSHVLDAGDNVELRQSVDYLRAGGDVTMDVWSDGPLIGFTGSIAYKRLLRITAAPRDVDLLKANVQFWLDEGEYVSVGYTYERGRDEDTTERVDRWKRALGVRF